MQKSLKWALGIFFTFMAISIIYGFIAEPKPIAESKQATEKEADLVEVPVIEESTIINNWQYNESVDEMRGTTTYTAITTSRNNVHLSSPYTGGTDLSIIVRHSDELNNEVLVVTNNGQLWCEYRNCIMTVKFDDKDIEQYPMSRAAGGSSEAMFLDGSEDIFINKLKDSKTTMLEIGFYNNGDQQFTLDTENLDWQH
ncbi:hypothetical protein [Psychrobacter sp. AOP7-A1-24]|uniref:hypothetical protein n=1 Tax=Psychrobacter sp. AOP7-A1-24 TaxID=3457646 RepID=UPI000B416D1D